MENAIWNGKKLSAHELAKDYFIEKSVRKASYQSELRCPDPDCRGPILKYCHGEIKEPYFAHRDNTECDYIQYEKSSGVFYKLRVSLYEHFRACGYPVQMEIKVLRHHYTHLLFQWENGTQTAIELGTKATTLREVEERNAEYAEAGIYVIWLVVDQADKQIREEHTYFLKRYCLNETNQSLIVIGHDGKSITQYEKDLSQLFAYNAQLCDLYVQENRLTLRGFTEAYEAYVKEKQLAREEQEERLKQQMQEINRYFDRKTGEIDRKKPEGYTEEHLLERKRESGNQAKEEDYIHRRNSILSKMNQQEYPVRDEAGHRWIQCEFCNEVKEDAEFVSYGGPGRLNLGICKRCRSNNENKNNL